MKLGFKLRQIFTEASDIARRFLNMAHYLLWALFDVSKFKIIHNREIKNVLVLFSGATGDTYNLMGLLNKMILDYPKVRIFYQGSENTLKFVKNPKITLLDPAKTLEMLEARNIDALVMIDYPKNFPKKFYLHLLKIPYRVGCNDFSLSLAFKRWPILLTRKVFPVYKTGIVYWFDCFKKLGFNLEDKMSFYFTKEGEKNAQAFLNKNKIKKNENLIFLHPGAGTISKALKEGKTPSHEWPEERWAKLADKLIRKYRARVFFTGAGEEKKIVENIKRLMKVKKNVYDITNYKIEDYASLMKRGMLLVSIDTSMAHIGAQSGIPVVDLFGPYKPELAQPWTDKKVMLFHPEVCNSCRRYACPEENAVCMKAITVEEIMQAAESLLK